MFEKKNAHGLKAGQTFICEDTNTAIRVGGFASDDNRQLTPNGGC